MPILNLVARPPEIRAMQFTGGPDNADDLRDFVKGPADRVRWSPATNDEAEVLILWSRDDNGIGVVTTQEVRLHQFIVILSAEPWDFEIMDPETLMRRYMPAPSSTWMDSPRYT